MSAAGPQRVHPTGWLDLRSPSTARAQHVLATELQLELSPSHPLRGLDFFPIAYCLGCDTVLVELMHPPPTCAFVRPSWQDPQPEDAPHVQFLRSWADCVRAAHEHRAGQHEWHELDQQFCRRADPANGKVCGDSYIPPGQ